MFLTLSLVGLIVLLAGLTIVLSGRFRGVFSSW